MAKFENINIPPDTISLFRQSLRNNRKVAIAKINSEFLVRAMNSADFKKMLESSFTIIVDGVGVQWAIRYLSLPLKTKEFSLFNFRIFNTMEAVWQMVWTGASLVFYPRYCGSVCERIPGQEAFNLMLEVAEKEKAPVYIFGGEEEVLNKAIEKIKIQFPNLIIAGYSEGWNYNEEKVIADINKSKAKLLIVALGSPKQEYWIRDNISKLKTVRVAVGEGGTLDFVAGTFKRAPKWMRRLGLEWLWRLFMNKSKTQTGSRFKRVWNAVPVFIYEVVKHKVRNEK